jgi:hypothetical protein
VKAVVKKVDDEANEDPNKDSGGTPKEALEEAAVAPAPQPEVTAMPERPEQQLDNLTQQYNEIRATQFASSQRTLAMTRVIREMIRLAPQLHSFDWQSGLKSGDSGVRLAAYAFLYVRPTLEAVEALVRATTQVEDKPFGQYWALQALNQAKDKLDCDTARRIEPILSNFLASLGSRTDRYNLLKPLLGEIRDIIKRLCD